MKKSKKILFKIALLALVILAAWAYYPAFIYSTDLTFKWEGAVKPKLNFRDIGASVNECLSSPILPEGQIFRSNEFFSGWNCDNVGNPDTILTLNGQSNDSEVFYCRKRDGIQTGMSFQATELSDLEFLETWDTKPEMVKAACAHLGKALDDIDQKKKVLIHCEAGRDRTGAISALIASKLLEDSGQALKSNIIDALECDYRKTASLKEYKYGRIAHFIKGIQDRYSSVTAFIDFKCSKT